MPLNIKHVGIWENINLKGAHQPECHLDDRLAAAEDER